ncbi:MAG: prepilin-type N-terminal cleavage/methylation domain-containing protein [Minisyncoccia bacterium]
MKNKGFSLMEFLIAVSITTIIVMVVATFIKDIFTYNSSSQASMTSVLEGRKVLRMMVTELRATTQGANDSYAIDTAATSTIIFYVDTNGDGVPDKIRYFLDNVSKSIKRGVIIASGSPVGYSASEDISVLINNVSNGSSTPLFDYYDKNYGGTTSPMTIPVDKASIRLVKITVNIDKDINRSPFVATVSSEAVLRNLKDNL